MTARRPEAPALPPFTLAVLRALARGPRTAQALGELLWPDFEPRAVTHGGADRRTARMSMALGRVQRRTGYVKPESPLDGGRGPSEWALTPAGRDALGQLGSAREAGRRG